MEKNSWEIWKIFWESGGAEIRTEFRKQNQPREWGGDPDGIWEKSGGGDPDGIWELKLGAIAKSAQNPSLYTTNFGNKLVALKLILDYNEARQLWLLSFTLFINIWIYNQQDLKV